MNPYFRLLPTVRAATFSLILATSLILLLVSGVQTVIQGFRPAVSHFDPIFYDVEYLSSQRRNKRSTENNDNVQFQIQSKHRDFQLSMKVDRSLFHPDAVIENSDGPIAYDTSRAYSGALDGEPSSHVHGIVTEDGYFDGYISSDADEYYMELSSRYSGLNNSSPGILYRTRDLLEETPIEKQSCASHELHLKRKEKNFENENAYKNISSRSNTKDLEWETKDMEEVKGKKTTRKRRWAVDQKKKTCMLFLQADHLFYQHFGSEEACIDVMTRHIQRVNQIYRNTDFDFDGEPDGISFMIKRVKVHTSNHSLTSGYRYQGDFTVIKFLEVFSEGDYDSFCLAYMFTFRDFEGGTLGLAWTGDLKNAGGVCERKGHFRGGLKSLNTGIITLLNYGKFVLPPVSHVTLAHEIGHNFGSPHDPESDRMCTPGGKEGNYIMYARATAGDQKNNNRFSPCSLKSIAPVLNFKARDLHGCFAEEQAAICGNREVEEGEECDCGWEEDCRESCCFPMKLKPAKWETPCRLKPGKECSPSQGPCCTGNCALRFGDKCRDDNGCRETAFCDGLIPVCPSSKHKPNKTRCNEESVCYLGECTGSICLAYGLESCQCNPEPWETGSRLCELCCKSPGEGQPCLSSFEWNESPHDVPDLFSKPGSPCKNYTGYCDPYHNCREVDPSGPLSTLRNLLLADEGLAAIATWIDQHWYAVLGFVALLVVTMIITAKVCGKKAKARLRKITVMHSNVEAIQVQRNYLDENGEHVVHPTAVRKKIPFKKKVRERRSKNRARTAKAAGVVKSNLTNNNEREPRDRSAKGSLWRRQRKDRAKVTKTEGEIPPPPPPPPLPPPPVSLATFPDSGIGSIPAAEMGNRGATSNSSASLYPTLAETSLATAPVPGPSGGVVTHQAKTAIVPNAKRKKRTRMDGERSKEYSRHQLRKKRTGIGKRRDSSAVEPTKRLTENTKNSESQQSDRRNIQVIFRPPFSVRVQVVPPSSDEKDISAEIKQRKPSSSKRRIAKDVKTLGAGATASSGQSGASASNSLKLGTGSFLQRRKQQLKSNKNSELRVLIPCTNEDEEFGGSPGTPASEH